MVRRGGDGGRSDPEETAAALFKVTGDGPVPRSTISPVRLRAGRIAGGACLTVLHTGFLRGAGQSEERIASVASWWDSPYFTGVERAGPRGSRAAAARGRRAGLRRAVRAAGHYGPKALATPMFASGQVDFLTAVALITEPAPGRSFTAPWKREGPAETRTGRDPGPCDGGRHGPGDAVTP
ncbi:MULTISPECIES: carboxymuconolactone decarboxylase family protein [Streptomyces]|uniref:carboxymuconolactone decarboxylase family protein n=1 Tax=Streptomyces TaxID=1883 RepID=UPI0007C59FFF|nr:MULTISPECIES: carboxymuconolactone decarboxylase family protein [Streptomyces]